MPSPTSLAGVWFTDADATLSSPQRVHAFTREPGASQPKSIASSVRTSGIVYMIAIIGAELTTALVHPVPGFLLHTITLTAMLVHGAIASDSSARGFVQALAIAPLIRIISLSMPLGAFAQEWRYLIAGIPLALTGLVLLHTIPFAPRKVGLRLPRWSVQSVVFSIGVAASGIALGYVEYLILNPEPMIRSWDLVQFLTASLILLVATGFVEEFLFRGIMQATAARIYGDWLGILYVSMIFGALHVGHLSATDVLFVTAVALYFAIVVRRTGSIAGVSLAHGLTNIMLFIILPLVA